ncbi:MAG: hypothetical protein ACK4NS_05430 [Saprospiraceae bacterium]
MKKFFNLFAFALFIIPGINAQVTPQCFTPPPPGAESCQTTCVYCNFDGYTGINNGFPSGGNTVCGAIFIHNDQWFGFVAGTSTITIDISTSNCQQGNGLQAAFFANCQDDALTCNPGTSGGGGQPLILSYTDFVPGQTYYLMIDGWTNDVCNYTINVLQGSVSPPSVGAPSVPQGPTQVCPGATATYSIPPVPGAGQYRWIAPPGSSINGLGNNVLLNAQNGTSVTVTFGTQGGSICVQVGNACSATQQACLPVVNQPIPPTVKPQVTLCFEDLPYTWDEPPFTTISTYSPNPISLLSTPFPSWLGCDSTVRQNIRILPRNETNIGVQYICDGECFELNGNKYCDIGGPFFEVYESWRGCDSFVRFVVQKVPVSAQIQTNLQTINCINTSALLTSVGSNGSNFVWTNSNWTSIGNQTSQSVNAPGTYHLIISNTAGTKTCKDTASITIGANIQLPGATASGGELNCQPDGGTVVLQGNSPTPGVNYLWTGPGITPLNQNQQNPPVNVGGTYTLTVTNPANNCSSSATAQVVANNTPPSVSLQVNQTLDCEITATPIVSQTNIPNATYTWTGPDITPANANAASPVVGLPGVYTVTVTNPANQCTQTSAVTVLQDIAAPQGVSAGPDHNLTCILPVATLEGAASAHNPPYVILWSGPGIFPGEENLLNPTVNIPGAYVLRVSNPVNQCFTLDTAIVTDLISYPTADAGPSQTINCATPEVVIGGASSQGGNFTAIWSGPGITPANQQSYQPTVSQAGQYMLTIANQVNGCTATDAVQVAIDIEYPTLNAGQDTILTCANASGIGLSGSAAPANVLWIWQGPGITPANANLPNPVVAQPGLYIATVRNPVNFCETSDTLTVTQDADVPTANAGPDLTINCASGSVSIDASGSSAGSGIVYTWSGPGITPANQNELSPQNLNAPGAYTLTVSNLQNACSSTDIVFILIDTIAPLADAGPPGILNCFNNGLISLDASASASGPNISLLWSGPGIAPAEANAAQPQVTQPGVYQLLVSNNVNWCTATAQVTIVEDFEAPVAAAGPDAVIDCISTTHTLGSAATSAGPQFEYMWSGPGIGAGDTGAYQPTIHQPGTYLLIVTNTANGCTASDQAVIQTNAVFPQALAGQNATLTCAMPALVIGDPGTDSGAGYQITWQGPDISPANQQSPQPLVSLPGLYILEVLNVANSCRSIDSVFIAADLTAPDLVIATPAQLNCQTLSTPLDATGSSTGALFAYQWSGPDIQPGNAGDVSPVISQPGDYTLLIVNTTNGCSASGSVVVTQNIDTPVAQITGSGIITCTTPQILISSSGSSAGPEFVYIWQGPGINSTNANATEPVVAEGGSYTLTIVNQNNFCEASDSVVVLTQIAQPTADAGASPTLSCALPVVQLDGSASSAGPEYAYQWSGPGVLPGQSGAPQPNVNASGVYLLTVTNTLNGCTAVSSVVVQVDSLTPFVNAGPPTVLNCANIGAGVTLDGSGSDTGPTYLLTWSGPGITPANASQVQPTVTESGNYELLVVNQINGCSAVAQTTVSADFEPPIASAGSEKTLTCAEPQAQLDGSGSQATAGNFLNYEWSGPGINAVNQNQIAPNVSLPGQYILTVANTANGCTNSAAVAVGIDNDPPDLIVVGDTLDCANATATLQALSGTPNLTYAWQGPGITPASAGLPNPTVNEFGSYTVVVTGLNGCTAQGSALVLLDDALPSGNVEGTILNCANGGVSAISATVSTPGAQAVWNGPGGFTSAELAPTVNTPGVYTLTITGPNGCQRQINAQVNADFALPQISLAPGGTLNCTVSSIALNAVGSSAGPNFTVSWSASNGGVILSGADGYQPVAGAAGVYSIQIVNTINGCSNTASTQVQLDPAVPTAFDLSIRDILCAGQRNGQIVVNGIQGGVQPILFALNGSPASTAKQFDNLTAGPWLITLYDANGCTLDTLVVIREPAPLLLELSPSIAVALGETVEIMALFSYETPLATIQWNYAPGCEGDPLCAEFSYQPLQSYTHRVKAIDLNGCTTEGQVAVTVNRKRRVFVPNAINLNGNDPANAMAMIYGGADVARIKQWIIYDRWGEKVFEARDFAPNDINFAWDGRLRNQKGHNDVYVWTAEIQFIDGETERFNGDITLIR